MPGNLDPPGKRDTQTPTTWSGRVQRQTRNVKPRKHRKHKWAAKRTFPKPQLPTQNRAKEIHPTTNFPCQVARYKYGAVYASSQKWTQIWTCLCLATDMDLSVPLLGLSKPPTDMDLSMPPHRYGPVSPQVWACLCLSTDMGLSMPPHRYWSVCASP